MVKILMRIAISKLFGLLLFSFCCSPTVFGRPLGIKFFRIIVSAVVFLVGIGTLGRVWCLLYIEGRKRSELVTEASLFHLPQSSLFLQFGGCTGHLIYHENIVSAFDYPRGVFLVLSDGH